MKHHIFFLVICWIVGCSQRPQYPVFVQPVDFLFQSDLKPFYHGVASGDPLEDAVVIWTRVTPEESVPQIPVDWEISTNESFENVIQSGTFTTDPSRDYTVKIDVSNLDAGFTYFYRFKAFDIYSVTGTTKTANTASENLNFAVVSCSNYEWGYFNAYGSLAKRTDLDAVIHLGDYIYEYGLGKYGDTTLGRFNLPAKEIITLEDYRTRYSLYRLDDDLRQAHGAHPFINIWDDHEVANDSYQTGAQNHQEDEGPYESRKQAAVQAYYEWLPIRENSKHYRKFNFGSLAELIMLDERLEGRSKPVESLTDPALQDPERSMLGEEQLSWLQKQLSSSQSQWKVIGNQVIFSYLNWGYEPSFTINLDSWDGYPIEQKRIADYIKSEGLKDIVFITGDTHSSWAFESTVDPFNDYDAETSAGAIAVEFGTTSINSANANERYDTDTVRMHEQTLVDSPLNPHLKYANLRDHGYLLLTLTPEEAIASWYYVASLREKTTKTELGKRLFVKTGETKLRE